MLLNWIGAFTLSLLLNWSLRKLESWFVLSCFFPLRFLFVSLSLPSGLAWNTIVSSGEVLLIAAWICWISCRNRYVGLLVLHSHSSLSDSSLFNKSLSLSVSLFLSLSFFLSLSLSLYIYMFRPSQDSSVWLGLTSREQSAQRTMYL